MSNNSKYIVGGAAAALLVLWLTPIPLWLILLVLVGVPVAGYLMLDPSQRRRLREGRKRGQLGP